MSRFTLFAKHTVDFEQNILGEYETLDACVEILKEEIYDNGADDPKYNEIRGRRAFQDLMVNYTKDREYFIRDNITKSVFWCKKDETHIVVVPLKHKMNAI
jgi:hypothetical protein